MIGSISLDQLRVLVTLADTGSFSAAGRKLGRAQSAISQAIATLESMQGVELFDRSGHRPQLTEVGRVLVDQARLPPARGPRRQSVPARVGRDAGHDHIVGRAAVRPIEGAVLPVEEHRLLVRLIEGGDGDGAEALIAEHLGHNQERLQQPPASCPGSSEGEECDLCC